MATYDNLPVYKVAYDFFLEINMLRSTLSREYKHTLGERLLDASLNMILYIYKANKEKDKKELIKQSQSEVEVIRLLLRLLKDIKVISLKRFIALNEVLESVSKQLTGWLKYQKE